MKRARWYSSSTTLLNGEVYIQGGTGGTDHPEIRSLDGDFRLLSGADTSALQLLFPAQLHRARRPGLRIRHQWQDVLRQHHRIGHADPLGQFTGPNGAVQCGDVPPRPDTAIRRQLELTRRSSTSRGGSPVVTSTQPVLASADGQRHDLADGKVLATGGSEVQNEMTGVNYSAEIWNPNTGQWNGRQRVQARLYHSTALLLPDASVLVAGGGAPGPQKNTNVEIYYPPYLYDASGGWAARPGIESAPSFIEIGETFAVDLASARRIDRVVMVKTGSVSHSWNMDQRFVELTFQQSGSRLIGAGADRAPPMRRPGSTWCSS